MDSNAARARFLEFFAKHGHRVVDSSSLVPGSDPTLMFTNAGMIQFKDVLLGFESRPYDKAATSQRCLRAGGKHNDLENVGYTARHHTFFEMLGNFSFGDYFKAKAIPLAWQLLTDPVEKGGYGLAPKQLWITVFGGGQIFGADQEAVPADDDAYAIWAKTLQQSGFSSQEIAKRITRIPKMDNFWMMGDTGPCGPCSEIFYNRNEDATRFEGEDPAKEDACVEIWNLVFMQFNRDNQGVLHSLPKPCVDTGMGLERLCAVLQNKTSNFDTDLFVALISEAKAAIEAAGGKAEQDSVSLRVIADHIRAAAYLVADQVLPSNEGRGYVLRRIIRRALRHGHQLGVSNAFFAGLARPLAKLMGAAHPALPAKLERVVGILAKEEKQFGRTLDEGMKILTRIAGEQAGDTIDGATAFKLYDTYGFPIDLTASYARDRKLKLDMEGFEAELKAQIKRSRAAAKFAVDVQTVDYDGVATKFERDPYQQIEAQIVALFDSAGKQCALLEEGQQGLVVLDKTTFYAESGGQVGEKGELEGAGGEIVKVDYTVKVRNDVHGHQVSVTAGELRIGTRVKCKVDGGLRRMYCRAHSAAHLLHEALRRRLGDHVEQRGSLVEADRLRFDFAHDGRLSDAELQDIEAQITEQILQDATVDTTEMPYDDALKLGARALFGEKYGAVVRVVTIDPEYSVELCGGTHVAHASQIGSVYLHADEAIAAGIRRISAHTGTLAQNASWRDNQIVSDIALMLKKPRPALADEVVNLRAQLKVAHKELAAQRSAQAQSQAQKLSGQFEEHAGGKLLIAEVEQTDIKVLKEQARSLVGKKKDAAVLLCGFGPATAVIVAVVAAKLSEALGADQWIKESSDVLGARGGGNAISAQAGAGNPAKVAEALKRARAYATGRLGDS